MLFCTGRSISKHVEIDQSFFTGAAVEFTWLVNGELGCCASTQLHSLLSASYAMLRYGPTEHILKKSLIREVKLCVRFWLRVPYWCTHV